MPGPKTLLMSLTLLFVTAVQARAERLPLPPEQLRIEATHVVTGTVIGVDFREEAGAEEVTAIVLTLQVAGVEKGERAQVGTALIARCFLSREGERSHGVGLAGHRPIPATGQRVRAYLRRGDEGTFAVVYPNGLAGLEGPLKEHLAVVALRREPARVVSSQTVWEVAPFWARLLLVGAVAALVGLVAVTGITDLRKRFRRPGPLPREIHF